MIMMMMKMMILTYLGPSASQSADSDVSAASHSQILVASFLQLCLFRAMDLRCLRSSRLVRCSWLSSKRDRSLLRTTGNVVYLKGGL
ncbi:hypothetical protein ElyMa_002014000 [Elysia marginata]|uniref:Secreted protein n=1 Tax=Elysia marginata TaxID=1093978 RepID=A0AAV4F3W0_9GAST|nr:hypothetical protein ElyMa_002014000 [Elysia marginata]